MSKPLTAIQGGPLDEARIDAPSETIDETSAALCGTTSPEDLIASIDKLLEDQLALSDVEPAPTPDAVTAQHGGDQWRRQFLTALRKVDHHPTAQTTSQLACDNDDADPEGDVAVLDVLKSRWHHVPYAYKDYQPIAVRGVSSRLIQTVASASRAATQNRHLALMAGTAAALAGVLLAVIPQVASLSAPANSALSSVGKASAVAQGTVSSEPPIFNAPVLVREGAAETRAMDAFAFAPGYIVPRMVQSLRVEEPARVLAPVSSPVSPDATVAARVEPSPSSHALDHTRLNELFDQTPQEPASSTPAVAPPPERSRENRPPRESAAAHRATSLESPASTQPSANTASAKKQHWTAPRQGLGTSPPPEPSGLAKLVGTVWPPSWPIFNPSAAQDKPPTAPAAAPTSPVYTWSDLNRPEP